MRRSKNQVKFLASNEPRTPLRYPTTTTVATDANRTARDTADFACTPSGFRAHADGQYLAGHSAEHSRRDRGLLAGANWCGRGRLLGWRPDWIAAQWKADPKRWLHPGLRGSWSDRLDRAAPASACG